MSDQTSSTRATGSTGQPSSTKATRPSSRDRLDPADRAMLDQLDQGQCEWYALCVRPAAGLAAHPAFGRVPVCAECAAKHELALVPFAGTVTCDECGGTHIAEYSHESRFGDGAVYAVVCKVDNLFDYYMVERVTAR